MPTKEKSGTRGGKRAGAGRKFGTVKRKAYTRRMTDDEREFVDKCLKEYRETHGSDALQGQE